MIKNAILVCEDDGTIVDLIEKGDNFREEAGVEYYSGILVPGFINAHCHLELSHLHKKIEEKTGLAGFIGNINRLREASEDEIQKAMHIADRKMWAAGVRAVGDVSNSVRSLSVKQKSKILYHTFVEVFGFHPSRAGRAFGIAQELYAEFSNAEMPVSIVPHAAYSVSEQLFRAIENWANQQQSILSVHNRESREETMLFNKNQGPLLDHYQKNLKLDTSHWQARPESTLQFVLKHVPKQNQLLLVHNTFMDENDFTELKNQRSPENTFLVVCPNSNLYIENTLPPLSLFQKNDYLICLGTDSLASNHQLSVLEEMVTIQQHFPATMLEDLITWACANGAKALGLQNIAGSFAIGKKPGVNLISGIDLKTRKLTTQSKVKRLL